MPFVENPHSASVEYGRGNVKYYDRESGVHVAVGNLPVFEERGEAKATYDDRVRASAIQHLRELLDQLQAQS